MMDHDEYYRLTRAAYDAFDRAYATTALTVKEFTSEFERAMAAANAALEAVTGPAVVALCLAQRGV